MDAAQFHEADSCLRDVEQISLLLMGRLDSATTYLRESLASPDTGNLTVSYRMLGEVAMKQGDYKADTRQGIRKTSVLHGPK